MFLGGGGGGGGATNSLFGLVLRISPRTIWACLGVNPLDMPEPLIGWVKENTLNNPSCPEMYTTCVNFTGHGGHVFYLKLRISC